MEESGQDRTLLHWDGTSESFWLSGRSMYADVS